MTFNIRWMGLEKFRMVLQSVILDVYYDYNETMQHQTKGVYNG